MNMKRTTMLLILAAALVAISGCLPDRLPPLPIEQERPNLETVLSPSMVDVTELEDEDLTDSILISNAGFAVSVDSPIVLQFDDMMDVSTFDGNVIIYSADGDTVQNLQASLLSIEEIIDTTVNADSTDTTITIDTTYIYNYQIDHPPFEEAMEYFMEILGDIRDTAGNSISIDPDFKLLFEFFTGGRYSENYIPRVYVADLTGHNIMAVDTLTSFTFTDQVERPNGFAISDDRTRLFVSDKSAPNTYLAIFDVATGAKVDSIDVGRTQIGLVQVGHLAAVATRTPKQVSFIDLSNGSVTEQATFSFTPIVIGFDGDNAYIGDAIGKVYIYSLSQHSWIDTIENVFTRGSRSRHLVYSDGLIYANDYNGDAIRILNSSGIVNEISLPEGTHPIDVAVSDYIYVAGADGLLLKYDKTTLDSVDATDLETPIASIDIVPKENGELIYAMLPDLEIWDYSGLLGIIDAQTLSLVRTVQVSNTASEVWIEPK